MGMTDKEGKLEVFGCSNYCTDSFHDLLWHFIFYSLKNDILILQKHDACTDLKDFEYSTFTESY